MSGIRRATHAGSWYSADEEGLSFQLDSWLDAVPDKSKCIGPISSQAASETSDTSTAEEGVVGESAGVDTGEAQFPTPGARIVIAP